LTGRKDRKARTNERENRTRRIGFRISEGEYSRVLEYLSVCGVTLSEFARKSVLKEKIVPKSDMAVLAELRRLGGLLKHIHNETRGAYSDLTRRAIQDLSAYVRALTEKRNSGENSEGNP
jgi:hypothetical protein